MFRCLAEVRRMVWGGGNGTNNDLGSRSSKVKGWTWFIFSTHTQARRGLEANGRKYRIRIGTGLRGQTSRKADDWPRSSKFEIGKSSYNGCAGPFNRLWFVVCSQQRGFDFKHEDGAVENAKPERNAEGREKC